VGAVSRKFYESTDNRLRSVTVDRASLYSDWYFGAASYSKAFEIDQFSQTAGDELAVFPYTYTIK
jgi:hypothetical protein